MSIITDQSPTSEDPQPEDPETLLTTGEAAARLRVVPQTVARWASEGRLRHTRTLGGAKGPGHRRFRLGDLDEAALAPAACDGAQ